jgi:LPXTG-site transpeptidase (sortase) family protein
VHTLTAAIVILAIAASLMPVFSPDANAQDCPVGQVLDASGACMPEAIEEDRNQDTGQEESDDPADEATQEPADQGEETPTPEGAEEPAPDVDPAAADDSDALLAVTPQAGYGTVTLRKYDCGADADAAQKTLDELRNSCLPTDGIGFYLINLDAGAQQDFYEEQWTDVDGLISWTVPNPVTVAFEEDIPDGYGYPLIFCGFLEEGVGTLSPYPSGDSVMTQLGVDQTFFCNWFNVAAFEPPDDAVSGAVSIAKYDCDQSPGVNPGSPLPDLGSYGCVPMDKVAFSASGGAVDLVAETGNDGPGLLVFTAFGAYGLVTVAENVPQGYGEPLVYCANYVDDPMGTTLTQVATQQATVAVQRNPGESSRCVWLNIPLADPADESDAADITIHKYECPYNGPPVLAGRDGLEAALKKAGCTTMDGVEFTIAYYQGSVLDVQQTGSAGPGTIFWNVAAPQAYTVTETVPDGYGVPVKSCMVTNRGTTPYNAPAQGASIDLAVKPGDHFVCYWINLPEEEGSIQINKYICPAGYDLDAPGDSPYADCTDGGNNITFRLNGLDPRVTGQNLYAAVRWDGLSAGTYTVTEEIPPDIESVFVMSCDGNSIPMIQSAPLSTGPTLDIPLKAGDDVVCSWYNVPKAPDGGRVTVVKYACDTNVFVSVDDCQLYEDGAGFVLSVFDGNDWLDVSTGYTNASGLLSFGGLADGRYQIDELGGPWCHAVADRTDKDGYLVVDDDERMVWIYNCNVQTETKQPVQYPNTGAGAHLQSLTSGAAPVLPVDAPGMIDPRSWTGALDSRLIAPTLSGDKPVRIAIEAINLNATVETLEIVNGGFQDPTTSDQVAWYKDTARLGEDGNLVMAGHLNYWGDPEGAFFALDQVEQGDEIAITADDGTAYHYVVTEVSLRQANSETLLEITQETGGQTLTLITCGGEWDPASKSYLHRTVVQAELVDSGA